MMLSPAQPEPQVSCNVGRRLRGVAEGLGSQNPGIGRHQECLMLAPSDLDPPGLLGSRLTHI